MKEMKMVCMRERERERERERIFIARKHKYRISQNRVILYKPSVPRHILHDSLTKHTPPETPSGGGEGGGGGGVWFKGRSREEGPATLGSARGEYLEGAAERSGRREGRFDPTTGIRPPCWDQLMECKQTSVLTCI